MAYVTLLSIIPSLAAILSIVAAFQPFISGDFNLLEKFREFLFENLATGSGQQAIRILDNLISNLNFTRIGVSSFIGLLVSLILLLRQIEKSLNKIWLVTKERNIFVRFIYFWTFLTLGTFFISLALGYLSSIGITSALNLDGAKTIFSMFIEKLYSYLSGYVIFLFLFKYVPNTYVPFKNASIGAIISTVLLDFSGDLFTSYVTDFSSHQIVYGALAALPLFLTWLYISWLIILFGSLISWRSYQGFKDSENDHLLLTPKDQSDRLLSHHIQALTPLLCLLEIYRSFWKNSEKITSMKELEENLDIPSSWLSESLDLLDEKNLIRTIKSHENFDALIPARPLEKISLNELYQLFNIDVFEQLNALSMITNYKDNNLPIKFIEQAKKQPKMSLANFLENHC